MKKLILATAIAALSVTAAQAAPTVYGKAFLTLDAYNGDAVDERTKLNSNASRIGLKGSEALTANTDVVYQLEYRVDVDSNVQQFTSRDTYLGVSNKQYGTLLAGRLSAIDGRVDYANVTKGGVLGGNAVLAAFDAPRANNAVAYVTPNYNGLTGSAMYVLDENKPTTDTFGRDAYGLAVQYAPAGAAYRGGASYISAGDEVQAVRVSGAYDITPATTVGALYQNTDLNTNDNENAFTVSAKHKTATPWGLYGQVDVVTNLKGVKDAERQRLVLGSTYAFNKAATGHIYAAGMNTEVNNNKDKAFGLGAGLEYNF